MAVSLIGVAPDSADTVFTGIISIEVVCVACLRAVLGRLGAVFPVKGVGR
jgi:hypothetical protein